MDNVLTKEEQAALRLSAELWEALLKVDMKYEDGLKFTQCINDIQTLIQAHAFVRVNGSAGNFVQIEK